jgi:hypothetical protein
MWDLLKNNTVFSNKYKTHSEAVIISCFFNPQNSPYRIKAFNEFYERIKHLPHRIVECVIGDAKPQLPESESITRVYTESLLWHKEALLNKIVSELPPKYKYVFWVDADVIFTNLNWMVEGVEELKRNNIVQPFEYCVHLDRDDLNPDLYTPLAEIFKNDLLPNDTNKMIWRSFCSNYVENSLWTDEVYNNHGHVGFAWGARREVLEQVPLYDKALIGGADHIIAHAAAGQINHPCITKSFTDNIDEVNEWSEKFYDVVEGAIGYVKGDLYHIWHGDIDKRQYLKRIQDFTTKTKQITFKDKNGLYIANKADDSYMRNYFAHREVSGDDGFLTSMAIAYMTDSTLIGAMAGGNIMGAMVGDMLHPDDNPGGGEFGGAGAGGDIDNNNTPNDITPDTTDTNLGNFS